MLRRVDTLNKVLQLLELNGGSLGQLDGPGVPAEVGGGGDLEQVPGRYRGARCWFLRPLLASVSTTT